MIEAFASCRSHLALEDDDPALGEKFSTATLQQGSGHGAVPSRVHGAPSTAAESREVLARLKRMAGFESQDFDPMVLPYPTCSFCRGSWSTCDIRRPDCTP